MAEVQILVHILRLFEKEIVNRCTNLLIKEHGQLAKGSLDLLRFRWVQPPFLLKFIYADGLNYFLDSPSEKRVLAIAVELIQKQLFTLVDLSHLNLRIVGCLGLFLFLLEVLVFCEKVIIFCAYAPNGYYYLALQLFNQFA